MSKSRKPASSPEQLVMRRQVQAAEEQFEQSMNELYATHGHLVSSWMCNEMSSGELTFEEAAVHLARNFMISSRVMEFRQVGEMIEKRLDEHTVGDAA